MAENAPIAELAAPLEKFVKELRSYHVVINEDILQLLRDAVSYTQMGLAQIEQGDEVDIPRLHRYRALLSCVIFMLLRWCVNKNWMKTVSVR